MLLEKQSIERDLKQRLEAPYIQKISELNAANEVLVNAFLNNEINYITIQTILDKIN